MLQPTNSYLEKTQFFKHKKSAFSIFIILIVFLWVYITFEIEYTNAFVDIDAEETLILALLENDDSAIQYLRKCIKDIRLVSE